MVGAMVGAIVGAMVGFCSWFIMVKFVVDDQKYGYASAPFYTCNGHYLYCIDILRDKTDKMVY